jgi:hypothetical protein
MELLGAVFLGLMAEGPPAHVADETRKPRKAALISSPALYWRGGAGQNLKRVFTDSFSDSSGFVSLPTSAGNRRL